MCHLCTGVGKHHSLLAFTPCLTCCHSQRILPHCSTALFSTFQCPSHYSFYKISLCFRPGPAAAIFRVIMEASLHCPYKNRIFFSQFLCCQARITLYLPLHGMQSPRRNLLPSPRLCFMHWSRRFTTITDPLHPPIHSSLFHTSYVNYLFVFPPFKSATTDTISSSVKGSLLATVEGN